MASEKKVLKLAEKLAKRGKLEEAVAEYQKLLTGNAQDINVRNTIGDLYVRLNQKDSAIKEFQTVARFYEEKGLYSQSIAIYKKINKLNPNDTNSVMKLAELYQSKGFRSEAKAEYLKIAKSLRESNKTKEAISLYEKLLKLDQRDIQSRSDLAELYKKEKLYDKAVEELNKVAEFKIQSNELKEAEEILIQAKSLKENHSRTLANLINVLKRGNKKKEAIDLINNILKKDKENLVALSLLGDFHFEDKDFKKAEEIFSKIISLRAKDVEARVKLGRINIYQEKLDQAYELYEPLVDSLINRHREEKAIGLLGLILKSKKAHLPSLEKLAFIYKSRDQKKNFEVASRIILEEYRKKNIKEKMYAVLSELIDLCPEDEEFNKEYNILKEEFGPPEEERKEEVLEVKEVLEAQEKEVLEEAEKPPEEEEREEIFEEEKEEPAEFLEGTKEILEAGLVQVDSFIEQGLMKSAKRILENLRLEYPDEAKIEEKIVALDQLASQVKEEEISVEEKAEKPPEEEKEKPAEFFKEVDEMLETNLAQVDLYIDQGLVRNARRILEDLRIKYPEEPRIEQKIDSLRKISTQIKEEEITLRVGKVTERESKLFGKTDQQYPSFGEKEGEEKLTSAEIFEETDITPIVSQEREEEKYYDLAEKIDEELEVIKAIFSRQLKGDTTAVEKELSDIVSEFKESIEKGIDKKDYESRYNLGIAFLEQGLVDEAIEELKVAAQGKKRALECYSILSHCFRQKKDFQEAVVWIENALKQSKKESSQSFELKYELASLYEKLKETKKALNLYNEIKKWNAEFRDVAKKIEKLGKESSK